MHRILYSVQVHQNQHSFIGIWLLSHRQAHFMHQAHMYSSRL